MPLLLGWLVLAAWPALLVLLVFCCGVRTPCIVSATGRSTRIVSNKRDGGSEAGDGFMIHLELLYNKPPWDSRKAGTTRHTSNHGSTASRLLSEVKHDLARLVR